MIKYWIHVTNPDTTGLVKEAFTASESLAKDNKSSWFTCLSNILHYFQLDKNLIFSLKSSLKKYLYKKFCQKYNDIWICSLNDDNRGSSTSSNKLRTYRLFKDKFVFENYLNWGSFCQRKLITKFRISAHNLEIERGRYKNIPSDQRFCNLCKNAVEDEIHFLLECPNTEQIRKTILNDIFYRYPNLKNLNNKELFIWLLSAEENYIYQKIYDLIYKLNSAR